MISEYMNDFIIGLSASTGKKFSLTYQYLSSGENAIYARDIKVGRIFRRKIVGSMIIHVSRNDYTISSIQLTLTDQNFDKVFSLEAELLARKFRKKRFIKRGEGIAIHRNFKN